MRQNVVPAFDVFCPNHVFSNLCIVPRLRKAPNGNILLTVRLYRLGFRDVAAGTNERTMIVRSSTERLLSVYNVAGAGFSFGLEDDEVDPNRRQMDLHRKFQLFGSFNYVQDMVLSNIDSSNQDTHHRDGKLSI